jgi:hypothetical protein
MIRPKILPERTGVTDSKTGRTERLRVKSGSRGEYDPSYFQQILLADRVNQKWLQEHAERQGLGGAVVGVHRSAPNGKAPPRLEPSKGIRATMTSIVQTENPQTGDASIRLFTLQATAEWPNCARGEEQLVSQQAFSRTRRSSSLLVSR